jgi:tyrosyl-tRNA synthetase
LKGDNVTSNIFEELRWRGLIYDETEGVEALVTKEKVTLYNGFDPTGDSLHIGQLVPMMQLARWQRFGHTPIALAGGGTGMVGDPSGRSTERQLLSLEQIEANVAKIKVQLASILDFEIKTNPAQLVNNADWLISLRLMEFLRDTGKHFTVNYMTAKDSVRSRLEREDGISFTEFSYMLLQAYDYLHLFGQYNCVIQAGGSDQWGNIVTGTELIRKVKGEKAYGLVYPLITRADGSKFGKTAEGESVWLDPQQTSPYRFYQWWLNVDDADAINYLKYFTWLNHADINELEQALFARPEQREAQRRLAQEVTGMVHGETAVTKAEKAADVLFGGDLEGLDAIDIREIFADVPSSQLAQTMFEGDGCPVVDLLVHSGLASSKGDARRSIQGGGIYLNNERVSDQMQTATLSQSIEGQFMVLRKGRKRYHLVQILN